MQVPVGLHIILHTVYLGVHSSALLNRAVPVPYHARVVLERTYIVKWTIPVPNQSGSVPWWTTSRCFPRRAKAWTKVNRTIPWWAPERKPVPCPIGTQRVTPRSQVQSWNYYRMGTPPEKYAPFVYAFCTLSTKCLNTRKANLPGMLCSGAVRYVLLPKVPAA